MTKFIQFKCNTSICYISFWSSMVSPWWGAWVIRKIHYLFTTNPFNYIRCKKVLFSCKSERENMIFLPASPSRHFFPQISVLQVSLEVMSTVLQTFLVLLGWYPAPFLGLAIFEVCFCYFFPLNFAESFLKLYSVNIPLFTHSFLGVEAVAVSLPRSAMFSWSCLQWALPLQCFPSWWW